MEKAGINDVMQQCLPKIEQQFDIKVKVRHFDSPSSAFKGIESALAKDKSLLPVSLVLCNLNIDIAAGISLIKNIRQLYNNKNART